MISSESQPPADLKAQKQISLNSSMCSMGSSVVSNPLVILKSQRDSTGHRRNEVPIFSNLSANVINAERTKRELHPLRFLRLLDHDPFRRISRSFHFDPSHIVHREKVATLDEFPMSGYAFADFDADV